jgi:hypothetical protein
MARKEWNCTNMWLQGLNMELHQYIQACIKKNEILSYVGKRQRKEMQLYQNVEFLDKKGKEIDTWPKMELYQYVDA